MTEPRTTTEKLRELTRKPWLQKGALGLFALYVFVLAAVAISVGTGEVTFGATVWGQNRWVLGQSAAIRISPRDPSRRGAFISGFAAEVVITPTGGQPRSLAKLESGATAQSVRLDIPADLPPGPAQLEVHLVRGPQGDVARAQIELVSAPPKQAAPRRVKEKPASDTPPPPVTVQVRPVGRVLVPELNQRLLVRAVDPTGGPVKTSLAFVVKGGKLEGLPQRLDTDAHGLAHAWVRPNYNELKLLVTSEGQPEQTLKLHGKPGQFTADVGPMVTAIEGRLAIAVESMHGNAPVHADLWQGGRWVDSTSGRLSDGSTRLELRAPTAGSPALVQVYRHFAAPGAARAAVYLWPGPDPVAALPAVMAAAQRRGLDGGWRAALATGPPITDKAEAERIAAWLLAGFPDKPPDPPVLVDTGPTLVAAATDQRNSVRRRVIWALSATGILVVVSIASLLTFHVLQLERRYQEHGPDEDHPIMRRSRAVWEALILLATIALAILGLIVMLAGLRWGVDFSP